jgi:uncharacterized membrane protein
LGALLPTLLTVFILLTGFNLLNGYLGEPLARFINTALGPIKDDSGNPVVGPEGQPELWIPPDSWVGPAFTIALAAVICFIVGFFLATIAGNRVYRSVERWVAELPVVRKVYPHAKQLSEFFFQEKPMEWSAVVAVEYPRRGIWSLGFMTAEGIGELSQLTERRLISVYMPTSPMPFTGYVISVPADDVMKLELTIEEAFRWIVSAGVVLPSGERSPRVKWSDRSPAVTHGPTPDAPPLPPAPAPVKPGNGGDAGGDPAVDDTREP